MTAQLLSGSVIFVKEGAATVGGQPLQAVVIPRGGVDVTDGKVNRDPGLRSTSRLFKEPA